jgi:hypothetical protein
LGDGILDECCLSTPSPDLDGDGDVDLTDYSFLITCAGDVAGAATTTGAGTCVGCECGCADFNGDGVVDPVDVAIFKLFVTGP